MKTLRRGSGLDVEELIHHPFTNAQIAGAHVSLWQDFLGLGVKAHALLPKLGIVGWDIAVGPDGPIIIECNDNPYHVLWQLAAGQGIKTPAFQERLNAANLESQSILRGKIDTFQAREKAKRGKS